MTRFRLTPSYPTRPIKGVTLIEMLVVMFILVLIGGLIVGKLPSILEKSSRAACTQNIKILTQAIIAESLLNGGDYMHPNPAYNSITPDSQKYLPVNSGISAASIYGNIYKPGTYDNLDALLCPNNDDGIPPVAAGYQNDLDTSAAGTMIDYWVVHAGNANNGTLNTMLPPGENVLVIERFTGAGAWSTNDNHGNNGGTIGLINGSAKFVTTFPQNTSIGGGTTNIGAGNVSD